MPVELSKARKFPVPPVCTAAWTPEDWQRWEDAHGVPVEPEIIRTKYIGTWVAHERGADGVLLYRQEVSA